MEIKPYLRKAQYHETDQMGIIHHANYIRWFEESRVDFMEQIGYGYDKSAANGIDFAVTGVTCEYKSMVRFADIVSIRLFIEELGNARMTIRYEVMDTATETLRAIGTSGHCYFDNEKKHPVSLKKALPDLFALLEAYAKK